MPRRIYSDEDKAVALAYYAACGNNLTKAAKDCNLPKQTLNRWLHGESISSTVYANRDIKKGELADKLERLAHILADSLAANLDKIDEATLMQSMSAIGIAVDKTRLLREQATQITHDTHLSDTDRAERIARIFNTARTRRDGLTVDR